MLGYQPVYLVAVLAGAGISRVALGFEASNLRHKARNFLRHN